MKSEVILFESSRKDLWFNLIFKSKWAKVDNHQEVLITESSVPMREAVLVPLQNREVAFFTLFRDLNLHLTFAPLSGTRESNDVRTILKNSADWWEKKMNPSGAASFHVLSPKEEEVLVPLAELEDWKKCILLHNSECGVNKLWTFSK